MHQDMNHQPVRVCHISKLRSAGLRPTRQRIALAQLLFANGGRHVTAEALHGEAQQANVAVSLATIYNTLNQFTDAGLLREVSELHQTNRLDANLERHHHLICTRCMRVVDFHDDRLDDVRASQPEPDGFEVTEYRVEARGLCPACRA